MLCRVPNDLLWIIKKHPALSSPHKKYTAHAMRDHILNTGQDGDRRLTSVQMNASGSWTARKSVWWIGNDNVFNVFNRIWIPAGEAQWDLNKCQFVCVWATSRRLTGQTALRNPLHAHGSRSFYTPPLSPAPSPATRAEQLEEGALRGTPSSELTEFSSGIYLSGNDHDLASFWSSSIFYMILL